MIKLAFICYVCYYFFMSKLFFVLIILSFMSCSKNMTDSNYTPTNTGTTNITEISAELVQLVRDFETQYNTTVSYSVTIDSGSKTGTQTSGGTIIGLCEIYSNGARYVYVNQDWFAQSTTLSYHKKLLVFHELGHCSMNRNHDCRTANDSSTNAQNCVSGYSAAGSSNKPYSIMYPAINPLITWYPYHPSYYLQELGNSSLAGSFYQVQTPLVDDSILINSFSMKIDETETILCD